MSQRSHDFIWSNERAFFGGAPPALVPDQLKSETTAPRLKTIKLYDGFPAAVVFDYPAGGKMNNLAKVWKSKWYKTATAAP